MGLGNLRDKLLAAGLVSEEEARRAEAEAARAQARRRSRRRRRAERGRDPVDDGLTLTPEERAAAEQKRQAREERARLQREREENRRRAARERRAAEDIRRVVGALGVEPGGTEAFFFQTRKGKIERLQVDAEQRSALETGDLAVVEHPQPHARTYALVPREGAEAILKIDRRAVRFYNRTPEEFVGGTPRRPAP